MTNWNLPVGTDSRPNEVLRVDEAFVELEDGLVRGGSYPGDGLSVRVAKAEDGAGGGEPQLHVGGREARVGGRAGPSQLVLRVVAPGEDSVKASFSSLCIS